MAATQAQSAEEGRQAGIRAQQAAEAFVHGNADPKSVLRPKSIVHAIEGDYELVVHHWNQLVSKVGEVRRFIRHELGAIVHLTEEEAARLLKGGAVRPTEAAQEATVAGQAVSPFDRAKEITAQAVPSNPAPEVEENPSGQSAATDATPGYRLPPAPGVAGSTPS